MTELEKVVKGLEEIIDYFYDVYRNDIDSYRCEKAQEYSNIAIDAIALLKENEAEPQTVLFRDDGEYCPHCSTITSRAMGVQKLHRGTMFCPYCGKAVTWNG